MVTSSCGTLDDQIGLRECSLPILALCSAATGILMTGKKKKKTFYQCFLSVVVMVYSVYHFQF